MSRQGELFDRLRGSVLDGPGALDPVARRAAFDGVGPSSASAWVQRVHERAATIEDEHVEPLREAGLSEDQVFELTVCASVGAADARLRAALRALGKEAP